MATVIDLQRAEDPRDIVHRAVQALAEGHPIVLPTETVYGLAAGALSADAVQQLIELKGRSKSAPLAIAVRSAEAAWDYVCDASPLARRFARRCWPGPLTLVVPCSESESAIMRLPESVRQHIVAADGGVGFRVVAHRLFEQLHQFLAAPLVLTSANRSGEPPATTGAAVVQQFGDSVPLILDDGPCRYSGPSTVVRVHGNRYEILREGVIERAAMRQFAKPIIAIVCTGNTCRSPMAEVLLREHFRRKTGSEDAVRVVSAGMAAMSGGGAAPQAVEVMGHRGLDLTGHASRPLDEQLINLADLVLTMTRSHRDAIVSRWPQIADRVRTLRLDGCDISDPVGAPIEVYTACADEIDRELGLLVDSLGDDWLPTEHRSEDR